MNERKVSDAKIIRSDLSKSNQMLFAKTTLDLVPYSELPKSEKQYDRKTVFETLMLIVKLGYRNVKE